MRIQKLISFEENKEIVPGIPLVYVSDLSNYGHPGQHHLQKG